MVMWIILVAFFLYKTVQYLCFIGASMNDMYAHGGYCCMSWKNICEINAKSPRSLSFGVVGANDMRRLYYTDPSTDKRTALIISPLTYERIKFENLRNNDIKDNIMSKVRSKE